MNITMSLLVLQSTVQIESQMSENARFSKRLCIFVWWWNVKADCWYKTLNAGAITYSPSRPPTVVQQHTLLTFHYTHLYTPHTQAVQVVPLQHPLISSSNNHTGMPVDCSYWAWGKILLPKVEHPRIEVTWCWTRTNIKKSVQLEFRYCLGVS